MANKTQAMDLWLAENESKTPDGAFQSSVSFCSLADSSIPTTQGLQMPSSSSSASMTMTMEIMFCRKQNLRHMSDKQCSHVAN